jgi:hypothetical protein
MEITSQGEIIATVCGTCGRVHAAHFTPDFCGACHARFDRGAPIALLRLVLRTSSSQGALELSPGYEAEFRGPWSARIQREVAEALGVGGG